MTFVADRMQGTPYTGVSSILSLTTSRGTLLSWFEGVVAHSSDEERERVPIPSARRDAPPLGYTAGAYRPGKATFEVTFETADIITTALAAESVNKSFGETSFTFQAQVYEPDKPAGPSNPLTTTYTGCNLVGNRKDWKPGQADGVTVAIPFTYVSKKEKDGKVLYSPSAVRTS